MSNNVPHVLLLNKKRFDNFFDKVLGLVKSAYSDTYIDKEYETEKFCKTTQETCPCTVYEIDNEGRQLKIEVTRFEGYNEEMMYEIEAFVVTKFGTVSLPIRNLMKDSELARDENITDHSYEKVYANDDEKYTFYSE